MQAIKVKCFQIIGLTIGVILATMLFLPSHGTPDMDIWLTWSEHMDTYGLSSGFDINRADYPPISSVILFSALQASHLFHIDTFDGIKLSIILLLFVSSFIFWIWTKDIPATLIFHASLILNSVALGYIDIYFTPTLVLSLWMLMQRKIVWFSFLFVATLFIKWQPLIIIPFVAMYIFNISRLSDWKKIDVRKVLLETIPPALIVVIPTFLAFGMIPVLRALKAAFQLKLLSGEGLNLTWIMTHFLHVFYPAQYGSLINGEATCIFVTSSTLALVPRIMFAGTYLITLIQFFRREKSFENFLLFSLLGYFAYFTFNVGVHENHLFIGMILAVALVYMNRKYLLLATMIVLICNINMFTFYGINGLGLGFSRVIGHMIDIALLLSIFNVVIFFFFWTPNVFQKRTVLLQSE